MKYPTDHLLSLWARRTYM